MHVCDVGAQNKIARDHNVLAFQRSEHFLPDLICFVLVCWSSIRCAMATSSESLSAVQRPSCRRAWPCSATRITNTLGASRTLASLASDSYPRASRYAGGGDHKGGGGEAGGGRGWWQWSVVEVTK